MTPQTFRAALVADCRGLMIDRITLVARLQVQRRATVVPELRTDRIAVVAEGTQPGRQNTRRARRGSTGPGRAPSPHTGISGCRKEFALGLDEKCSGIAPVTERSGKKSEAGNADQR